jgi:hypothetical protein
MNSLYIYIYIYIYSLTHFKVSAFLNAGAGNSHGHSSHHYGTTRSVNLLQYAILSLVNDSHHKHLNTVPANHAVAVHNHSRMLHDGPHSSRYATRWTTLITGESSSARIDPECSVAWECKVWLSSECLSSYSEIESYGCQSYHMSLWSTKP